MDPARSAAARDRAERFVFDALPDLDAVPRRALALTVLSDVPRAGIASEVGLAGAELSVTLAVARKALRRTRSELASGGRCERAERALSDRLDGALGELDARFLDAHLARCARCRTHEADLAVAAGELRAGFAAPPEPVQTALPAADEPRARLRVVPPTPLLPPAPEPPALDAPEPPAEVAGAHAAEGGGSEEPPAALPPAARRHQRIRAALPVAVAVLIAVGLVAAAIALLSAFGADQNIRAPWDSPNAPIVHPAPISGQ